MEFVMIGARGQAEHDTLARLVNRGLVRPRVIHDLPPDDAPPGAPVVTTRWETLEERIHGDAMIGTVFSLTVTVAETDDAFALQGELTRLKAGYPAIRGMWIQSLNDPAAVPETCPECGRAYD